MPTLKSILDLYEENNIDYSEAGFYDLPEFVAIESQFPAFLESYAQFVLQKKYSAKYSEKAKLEIPFIVKILNQELINEGRKGACIDMSMAISRILEKEGYWNYVTKGSLVIDFPNDQNLKSKYFYSQDIVNATTGHAWVVAPPFSIIDATIKQQGYLSGEENQLPNIILSNSLDTCDIYHADIVSANLYNKLKGEVNHLLPRKYFTDTFKPIIHTEKTFTCKYITTGISASDLPLEEMSSFTINGKLANEIYNEIVAPKLKDFREQNDIK